jgi:hypothetical protein
MSIVFIIGLPASGKTSLALQRYPDYILIDDPKTKPIFNLTKNYVVTDPHLCKFKTFNMVKDLYPEAYYIFFTNNPEQCCKNLQLRKDGRNIKEEYIYKLSFQYQPEIYLNLVNNKELIEVYNGY